MDFDEPELFTEEGQHTGNDSAIDIYLEGTKIGTLNSSVVGLKTYSFNVTAASANSLSRLQFHAQNSNSFGGVIDNVSLVGKGFNMGAAIPLSVSANLSDSDGSESLSLAIMYTAVGVFALANSDERIGQVSGVLLLGAAITVIRLRWANRRKS